MILFYFYFSVSVISYGHVIVKISELASSLKPDGKVHYFVVNALCRLLFHMKHPKNSYKHFFFSKVGVSMIYFFFFQLYVVTIWNNIDQSVCVGLFIGNHGPNDSKEQELYDNALKCFRGAARARPLANSQYVSSTCFYFYFLSFSIYVVCTALVLIISSFSLCVILSALFSNYVPWSLVCGCCVFESKKVLNHGFLHIVFWSRLRFP